MSKQIDESKPLSAADRQYLEDRGQYHVIERIERGQELSDEPEQADDDGLSDSERQAGKTYDKWTAIELSAEVNRRNADIEADDEKLVPASSKKSDLVDALRSDDAALAASEDAE